MTNPKTQPADNWSVIGATSRTATCKLVKNLKYAKIGLAVGALDQFVIKFRGPYVFGTVEDIRSNEICRFERGAS